MELTPENVLESVRTGFGATGPEVKTMAREIRALRALVVRNYSSCEIPGTRPAVKTFERGHLAAGTSGEEADLIRAVHAAAKPATVTVELTREDAEHLARSEKERDLCLYDRLASAAAKALK